MKRKMCPKAIARIQGGREYLQLCGVVRFYPKCDAVMIEVEINGLPKNESGFFALHIHEGGNCNGDGFPNSGGHLNSGITMHPNHTGDLPPLMADHGKAYMKVFTDRFRLQEVIGRTVIVHSGPDDFHTQPSGNSGKKIGCGVIHWV